MAERSLVDLVEDWQTGAFVVLACLFVGVALGAGLSRLPAGTTAPTLGVLGFVVGAVGTFLAYSYLRYGR